MRALALLLMTTAMSMGQEPGFTISTGTQLVIETVSVTDKKGNPVEGLTAKDFTVLEDGVAQPIKIFEYQKLADAPVTAVGREQLQVFEKLGRTRIAAEAAGANKYRDRRLVALYFDMTSMPQADQLRALAAAQQFVRTQMTAADLVALLRYSGSAVDVLQDFTADRNRLLSLLQTMIVGEGQGFGETNSAEDQGAAFGQDDSEFNIFNTDRQLAALQTAAQMLGQLSEKKSLVYFASGLRLNGLNNQAQLRATINAAIRAGVSFWPIDARGLVAQAPMGDPSKGSPGGVAMYSGAGANAVTNSFQQSQDTLYALAADTGGKALLDDNNLSKGITAAAKSIANYYIIGYYSSNAAEDGKFRRVKVSLNGDEWREAKLEYRQGYYAAKKFSKFTVADKERQLEDALMLADPITELTIAMEIDYFQLNKAEYFVPVAVKIPGRELALAKRHGTERTTIDFIGEIKNSFGSTVMNVRDKVTVKLSESTAAELAQRPILYDTGFTLLPGTYTIKFLARDAETGRIGTYQAKFVVPNLNKESDRLAISSVVLSSQRVDLKEAVFNAVSKEKEREKAEQVNPLIQNGSKLLPSVTRVFRKDQTLQVYAEAYEAGPEAARPVMAYVSLYKAGVLTRTLESAAVKMSNVSNERLKTVPVRLEVPLQGVEAGTYECQVTVLDPVGQKAAFWRAGMVVLP